MGEIQILQHYRATRPLASPDPFRVGVIDIGLDGKQVTTPKIRIWKAGHYANMDAGIGGLIEVSPLWIDRLLTGGSTARLAYMIQLGHEHTHHLMWIFEYFNAAAIKTYICWINECYADVNGCRMALENNKNDAISATEYLLKNASRGGLIHTKCHPSWEFRKKLVERGIFDEESVQMIQKEVEKYCNHKIDAKHIREINEKIRPYFFN